MDTPIPKEILDQIKFSKLKKHEDSPFPYPIGIKPQTKPCDDCGRVVKDRKEEIREHQFPQPHWRKRCKACKKTWNPHTHAYDLTDKDTPVFFRRLIKERDK